MDYDVGDDGQRPDAGNVTVRRDGPAVPGKRGPRGPWRWTEETIREKADSLARFYDEDPAALYLETWCSQERIPTRYISRFAAESDYFRSVLERVNAVQASRLLELSSRTLRTEKGSMYTAISPRIAILVLQCRHSFIARQEVVVEASSKLSLTDALRQQLPPDEDEARRWLQRLADGQGMTDDAKELQEASQFLIGEYELRDLVATTPSAIVDF